MFDKFHTSGSFAINPFPLRIPPPFKTAAEGGEKIFLKGVVKELRIPPFESLKIAEREGDL